MAIITLTTDFGTKDHYVGAVKGTILNLLGQAHIVDISHQISPFNIFQAAYVLGNCYHNFPKGTIHIIGVDSEKTAQQNHLVAIFNGHYFIGTDNGIFSLLNPKNAKMDFFAINPNTNSANCFPEKDVFSVAACQLAQGKLPKTLGSEQQSFKTVKSLQPAVNPKNDLINGSVIYIDRYGNVVSNITRSFFENYQEGRNFEILARNHRFKKLVESYSQIRDYTTEGQRHWDDGKKLALFNSSGYLELAVYRSNLETVGGASTLLGIDYRDPVAVRFF